ncbi:hypothetical protein K3495_g6055 [Podosphaera aphanis]|nr:hypothetical protein K3495_g6055 [Podosphaera aphanis]
MTYRSVEEHPVNTFSDVAAPYRSFAAPPISTHIARKVENFLAQEAPTSLLRQVQEQTRAALTVIRCAIERYSVHSISISYNGGKDCLVLLILVLAVLAQPDPELPAVYVMAPDPFPEVDAFIDDSVTRYPIQLARYALPMKDALACYLSDYPSVQAVFVGTRRTDPHGQKLSHFDHTDDGWPPFMRVHPIIDWHYAEIWAFIRFLEIPYCPLYDRGYTSIGGVTNTRPNPVLKLDEQTTRFKPAYELMEDEAERLGRDP